VGGPLEAALLPSQDKRALANERYKSQICHRKSTLKEETLTARETQGER